MREGERKEEGRVGLGLQKNLSVASPRWEARRYPGKGQSTLPAPGPDPTPSLDRHKVSTG